MKTHYCEAESSTAQAWANLGWAAENGYDTFLKNNLGNVEKITIDNR